MPESQVPQCSYEQTSPLSRQIWDGQIKAHGRMTNMKRTLAHSGPALRALMEWYPLRDAVETFLGPRLTTLFAHAVSTETDCLICSTFFRRLLKEAGEDPDHLVLSEFELAIVRFGQELVRNNHRVSTATLAPVRSALTDQQMVELTAFGGLMVATNLFNNALRVELDDYLAPYQGMTAAKPK